LRLNGEFQPGALFKIAREKVAAKRFTFTTQAVCMAKVIFQPALKFENDYMRFFNLFDRAEPLCETGVEISARSGIQHGLNSLHLIFCSGSQLKSQPGLKFAM